MEVAPTVCVPVAEATQVGEARRVVARLAERRGLGETAVAEAALVATELAGNLVKHTPGGGELLVRPLDDSGIEILALDRGPGMENVALCLQDGFSTAGSPGTGLGAVSRLSDLFQVFSSPGLGTAILARVGPGAAAEAPLELGVVSCRKPGQEVCGDAWAAVLGGGRLRLLVVDGLGHGSGAAEASQEAVRSFRQHPGRPPAELLDRMHEALRPTRGGAVAVAEVDPEAGEVRFAGVGNIAGVVLDGAASRSTVSHNGIVGHEMRRVQEFSYPIPPGAVLVLHSDGISGRWDAARYPGLLGRHPSLIAGVLYRDFARGSDDATVAVVRRAGPVGGFGV
jgi:anti-sigma regulatory factor (Ser/Thr protein kinase)